MSASELPQPYGLSLKDRLVDLPDRHVAEDGAREFRSHRLSSEQLGLVELLLSGALSPVDSFHISKERERISEDWKLINGTPWPVPLSLLVQGEEPELAQKIALRDAAGSLIATLMVEDADEVEGGWALGGTLRPASRPQRHDFRRLRLTPAQIRAHFAELGWSRVMGVMTRSPVLNRDLRTIIEASQQARAHWLIGLLSSGGGIGDRAHAALVRSTQAMLWSRQIETEGLVILPLPKIDDPARDLALRALVARNCGCSVILTDELIEDEKLKMFLENLDIDLAVTRPGFGTAIEILEQMLRDDEPVPANVAPPAAVEPWRPVFPPKSRAGTTFFFTGLSCSGKSTLAHALAMRLQEIGSRPVSFLDGEYVRQKLLADPGSTRDQRELNTRRMAYLAKEITRNGGAAVCAAIAPCAETRAEVRQQIEAVGEFVEIHVATPLDVCEKRDHRGLFAKARAGVIQEFAGISGSYDEPQQPEVRIDTAELSEVEALEQLVLQLRSLGHID